MSFLVPEPSASPTEAFPPKRTKNLGSLFRLSWGSTHRLRLAGTGRPQRQPQPYIGPALGTLDDALNPGEIHLIVVVEDLEGHAGGLRRVRGGGEVSADRVGRRRRLVAESDGSAHLDGIDEHFPASHRGRKYSADERKPELRVLCSVSGVETRGVRESGPSREGLLLEAAGQGCLTLRAWSSGAWSFRRQTWRSRHIHLLQISSSEVGKI